MKPLFLMAACAASLAFAGVQVGQKLPEVSIAEGGILVPPTKVVSGRMVMDGKVIARRPWALQESRGRICTIYHLAARIGVDDLNKPFIDALIAAKLPEFTPDGAYKTITILNIADALWGTTGIVRGRLEDSQRDFPYAMHVMDDKGVARAAWDLKPKTAAVIILDRDGTVLFFKEGKLSPEEITRAVGIIKAKVG
jgi:hypothetical protein